MMTIQVDSREKEHAIERILAQFDERGVKYHISKLYCADYMSLDNARLVIDRKHGLAEVCGNLCQQHERFRAECIRAKEAGIKIILLVEQRGLRTLDDVARWRNPRLKKSPKAMTGETMVKAMGTMAARHDIEWRFCDPAETGYEIVRLLEVYKK